MGRVLSRVRTPLLHQIGHREKVANNKRNVNASGSNQIGTIFHTHMKTKKLSKMTSLTRIR